MVSCFDVRDAFIEVRGGLCVKDRHGRLRPQSAFFRLKPIFH